MALLLGRFVALVFGALPLLLGGLAPLYAPRLSTRYQTLLRPPLDDALGGAVRMVARIFAGAAEKAG